MKKITLTLTMTLGLVAIALAALWGSQAASAGEFLDGVKCYRTKNVSEKGDVIQRIYVSDQFEAKDLIIKKPISFCARAEKPGGDQIGGLTDLLCYGIKDAPGQRRFQGANILAEDQFYGHFFALTKPYSLCETAQKSGGGGDAAGRFLQDFTFKCYRARYLENPNPDDEFQTFNLPVFDQFGEKDVRIGRPSIFCTQVIEKKQKAKNDDIENARLLEGPDDEHHASTLGAERDRGDPPTSCAPSYGHSVWYTYTPASDEIVDINTIESTYDTVLAVYKALPNNDLEEVDCNDDYIPGGGYPGSAVETKLEYGQKYYIMVGAYAGSAGGKLKLQLGVAGVCSSCDFAGSSTGAVPGKTAPVGGAAGEPPLNLVCYSISQRAPDSDSVITSDQLGAHLFDVGRGVQYCTPAEKCILLPPNQQGVAGVDINYCKGM